MESKTMQQQAFRVVRPGHPLATVAGDVLEEIVQFTVPDSVPINYRSLYILECAVEGEVDGAIHHIGDRPVRLWKIYADGTSFPAKWDFGLADNGTVAHSVTYELDIFELSPVK